MTRGSRLGFGGGSCHAARGEEDKPLAGVAPFHRTYPIPQSARSSARAARLSAAPPPQRQSEPACVKFLITRQPAWRCKRQLARRATAARRKREASRCAVYLPYSLPQTATSAARRARVATLSAAPPPQRQLKTARMRLLLTRQPAWRWKWQLARRATAARRKREAFRCAVFFHRAYPKLQPAQRGARARRP